ncbi:MAG: hypothetical protein ABR962_01185 [Candidatus Bathyarchaeia archaeon]|jgi:hypothetical protein
MSGLFSGRKKLKVDCGELEDGKDPLSDFLRKNLNEEVASDDHNLLVDSAKMSAPELRGLVNKFIYHQHLNNRYWVALERSSVKIHKFKEKKSEKRKKHSPAPATIQHGWL